MIAQWVQKQGHWNVSNSCNLLQEDYDFAWTKMYKEQASSGYFNLLISNIQILHFFIAQTAYIFRKIVYLSSKN